MWGHNSRSVRAAVVVGAAVGLLAATAAPAVAAVSPLSNQVSSTYQTNGRVWAILSIGSTVYIGGTFTTVRPPGAAAHSGEVPRSRLAAFDRDTGALLPWNPGANKDVYALTASLDGTAIYVGGWFAQLGGANRSRLAEVDATTGAVLPWAPRTDNKVQTIAVTPTKIYLGGTFTTVNGQPRSLLAAVDAAGVLDPTWQPVADTRVLVVTPSPDGTSIFVGGEFLAIDGQTSQRNLTRLDPDTGAVLAWKFHPGYPVHGIVFGDGMLYAAGDGSGGHIGAFDLPTGARLWVQQTDGGVQNLVIMDGVIYGGGHFDNVCVGVTDGATVGFHCPQNAATRHKLVAIDAVTGDLDPWNPGANSPLGVFGMTIAGGDLAVGGDFTRIGGIAQQGYAQFAPAQPQP